MGSKKLRTPLNPRQMGIRNYIASDKTIKKKTQITSPNKTEGNSIRKEE
jgi:hypothetical protein